MGNAVPCAPGTAGQEYLTPFEESGIAATTSVAGRFGSVLRSQGSWAPPSFSTGSPTDWSVGVESHAEGVAGRGINRLLKDLPLNANCTRSRLQPGFGSALWSLRPDFRMRPQAARWKRGASRAGVVPQNGEANGPREWEDAVLCHEVSYSMSMLHVPERAKLSAERSCSRRSRETRDPVPRISAPLTAPDMCSQTGAPQATERYCLPWTALALSTRTSTQWGTES